VVQEQHRGAEVRGASPRAGPVPGSAQRSVPCLRTGDQPLPAGMLGCLRCRHGGMADLWLEAARTNASEPEAVNGSFPPYAGLWFETRHAAVLRQCQGPSRLWS